MLKDKGRNTVKKGEVIFYKGENLSQVGIVLSGKVVMQSDYVRMVMPQGTYLALNEIGNDKDDKYFATYAVAEDAIIMAVPVVGEHPLRDIVGKNTDYRAIMISSQFRIAVEIYRKRTSLLERSERLYSFALRTYEEYKNVCMNNGVAPYPIDEFETPVPYEITTDVDENRVGYYEEAAKVPLSANKTYFSYSEEMVIYQVDETISFIRAMLEECRNITEYVKGLIEELCQRPANNLYELICQKAHEIAIDKDEVPDDVHILTKGILDEVTLQHKELKKDYQELEDLDIEHLNKLKEAIVSANGQADSGESSISEEEREAKFRRDMASLDNSMAQILKYADFPEKDSNTIIENVNYLEKVPDRLSAEDDVKRAKKSITPLVFKLYLACYMKIKSGTMAAPKSVELFMNFGMLDEKLLDREQVEFLCRIEPEKNEGPCNVYTMTEWLDMIYEGKREPSKSEFDEDYTENLRSLKKQGEITEEQQKALLRNMDKRVEYEVMNMVSSNVKSVYGQPSSYMPILFKEAIFGYLDKLIVTKKKINDSVKKILETDYSAFYREALYTNVDLKIAHENIMVNVYPDIILMPIFGSNAAMWQEIGSKDKKTPGRFCFPIMTAGNIDDLMVKTFGRFRWELCRCIQGMSWNDVKVKSLTSEYMDYIQFYRKNRDLSDDAKDKIKLQIQKARNNSREIFLIDYEAWIKNESNGSMKMNKVAREILATYCPFNKALRNKINVQKPYELAQARFLRLNQKKKQEIAVRIKAVKKITDDVPKELMDTYDFYANM